MTNDELSAVARKVFNPLPGEGVSVGSPRHFGSRLQPNSPGDDEEEILFSVLDAPPEVGARLEAIYRHARRALYAALDEGVLREVSPSSLRVRTLAPDRERYLSDPPSGERLRAEDAGRVAALYGSRRPQLQFVLSDGLNADALNENLRANLAAAAARVDGGGAARRRGGCRRHRRARARGLSRGRTARRGLDSPPHRRAAGDGLEHALGLSNLRARRGGAPALEPRPRPRMHDGRLRHSPEGEAPRRRGR
jgi:hypothetical protein